MYKAAENKAIGAYLEKLITVQFSSDRQFAIAYLKERYDTSDPATDDIQKMANKLCQIKKGNKGIQITDLPIFSHLLGVSVDSILSAGEVNSDSPSRITNYYIASSNDKEEWIRYVKRPDKLILNPDEYGKTLLDYAFEFKNYGLLKFLMNEGYIWFVGKDSSHYTFSFDAGTSIERRLPLDVDMLDYKMAQSDHLRTNMIALALDNADYTILDELHAREIPEFYLANSIGTSIYDLKKYYNRELLKAISNSSDNVLLYFSEEFEVQSNGIMRQKFTYTFPFLGKLIDEVIKKNGKAAPSMLKKALKHNKNVLVKLEVSAEASYKGFLGDDGAPYWPSDEIEKYVMQSFSYHKENDTVSFFPKYADIERVPGVFSNIIKISASSKDAYVQSLIDDVNSSYSDVSGFSYSRSDC